MRHKKAICFVIGAIVLLAITSCAVSPGEGEVYDIISTREKLAEIAQERDDSIDVFFAGTVWYSGRSRLLRYGISRGSPPMI